MSQAYLHLLNCCFKFRKRSNAHCVFFAPPFFPKYLCCFLVNEYFPTIEGDLVRVAKEGSSFFGRTATVTDRNWKQTGRVEVMMEPDPPQTRWTSMRSSFIGSAPNVLGASRRPSAGSPPQNANSTNTNNTTTSARGSSTIAGFASSVSSSSPVGAAIAAPTPEELIKTYKPRELELVSRPDKRRPSKNFAAVAASASEVNRAKNAAVESVKGSSTPKSAEEQQAGGVKSLAAAVNNSPKSDNDDEDDDEDDDDGDASSGDNSEDGVCFFGDVPGDSSQIAYGWPQDNRKDRIFGSVGDVDARKARRRSRRRKRNRSSVSVVDGDRQSARNPRAVVEGGGGSGSSSDLSDACSSAEDSGDEDDESSAAWAAREAAEVDDDAIASEDEVNPFKIMIAALKSRCEELVELAVKSSCTELVEFALISMHLSASPFSTFSHMHDFTAGWWAASVSSFVASIATVAPTSQSCCVGYSSFNIFLATSQP